MARSGTGPTGPDLADPDLAGPDLANPDLANPDLAGPDLADPVIEWYDGHARDLPWRVPGVRPWPVLVSEVMLQQTPVARVLPVWQEWMRRWPTAADLAAEPAGEAIRAWGRLGYPRRAVRLHQAACAVTEQHAGELPSSLEELRALPGVGEYTAHAVAAFAFGRRHPVVDVNVRRVHARAVTGTQHPAASLSAAETALARRLLPVDAARAVRWSVAVMELGALVCTARAPRCPACPIAARCAWLAAGRPASGGPPRRGQKWHGTDRQVRGLLLQSLRSFPRRTAAELAGDTPDVPGPQRLRCLDGLIVDGLVEPLADEVFRLPGAREPARR